MFFITIPKALRFVNNNFLLKFCRARHRDQKNDSFDQHNEVVAVEPPVSRAFAIYLRHLEHDGIVAAHISTRHLDICPVLAGVADHYGLSMTTIVGAADRTTAQNISIWVLMASDPDSLNVEPIRAASIAPQPRRILWTDSYSDLFRILKFGRAIDSHLATVTTR